MKASYYSHGKLLLSGEYLVLDGATALAVPTRQGQWLRISPSAKEGLAWISKSPDGAVWFKTHFTIEEIEANNPQTGFPSGVRERLLFIIRSAREMNPQFSVGLRAARVETELEFPREWGLGSSSTLISNLALWAEVDPYALLEKTLGGSGYDIAAARSTTPFYYTLNPRGRPDVSSAPLNPPFADALFFVYLNQKQDSREGIARYRNRGTPSKEILDAVSEISKNMAEASTLDSFRKLLDAHEELIGEILGMEPVKNRCFRGYPGSVKSLGAWGGDFVMATGTAEDQDYFREKGYAIIRPYRDFLR